MLLGAIEAGGTKFICAVGNENGEIIERISIPTTMPDETMEKVISFLRQYDISALGVGCFGPIDLDVNSSTYGYITSTPKIEWQNYNIVGKLRQEMNVPIAFDTDVNAAALGENTWGAARNLGSCIYITVGTGIGVGAVVEGRLVHGLMHPEMGHILVQRHQEDTFEGGCPFHKDCLESLASGPAMEKRWNMSAKLLPENHKAWEMEAFYLGQAVMTYILTLSPEKIIIGGGVLHRQHLLPLIREKVLKMLNGYVQSSEIIDNIDSYIVYPKLGNNAGINGALALAKKKLKN